MPFSNGDPVCACIRVVNNLPVGETDTGKRIYRDVIGTAGEWNIGDTIKIKSASYKFFGYEDSSILTDPVIVGDSNGNVIASTTSGQGTGEVTITLSAAGPDNDTLVICYRCGVTATYNMICSDRGHDKITCHKVNLTNGPHSYEDIFNQPNPKTGLGTGELHSVTVDGMSIQTDPAS